MLNINVMDERGFSFQIDLVRFFRANESNYLMYTLNELDESGYVKLYAAKMIDEGSFARIEEETEWANVKDLIKLIVKEAREGTVLAVQDLNEKRLEGIRVLSTRAFKLNNEIKEALAMNRPVFEEEMPVLEPTPAESEEPIFENNLNEEAALEVSEANHFTLENLEENQNYLEEPKEVELESELTQVLNQMEAPELETPELEEASLEGFKALFGDNTFNFDLPKEPEVTEPQHVGSLDELLGTPTYSYETEETQVEEMKPEVTDHQNLEAKVEELTLKVKEYEELISKLKAILN